MVLKHCFFLTLGFCKNISFMRKFVNLIISNQIVNFPPHLSTQLTQCSLSVKITDKILLINVQKHFFKQKFVLKTFTPFLQPKSKYTFTSQWFHENSRLCDMGSTGTKEPDDCCRYTKHYLVATGEVADGSFLRIRCLAPSRSLWEWDALDICLSVSISHERTLLLQNTMYCQYHNNTSQ